MQKYIETLKKDIEDKFNQSFRSAGDFDTLERLIKTNSDGSLNTSTLKRIWGYSKTKSKPLRSTLTVLARVLGFRDWESYVAVQESGHTVESGFISDAIANISDMKAGDKISFKWNPDRSITLICRDKECFEVLENENSGLRVGDRFYIRFLQAGYPLYCEEVIRNGLHLGDYIAGKETGIFNLNYLPAQDK